MNRAAHPTAQHVLSLGMSASALDSGPSAGRMEVVSRCDMQDE